jgi:hypothetical protein
VFAAAATEDDGDAQLAIRHGGTLLSVIWGFRRPWRPRQQLNQPR